MQLPWAAIPKFIPGSTDVTEYSRKMEFLAAMWPKEHLPLLAPRAALLCEGTAFKKLASLPPSKLQSTDDSGVKLLVSTLGGSWGKTVLEEKYDRFEKAIYGTVQKADETNDSYLARHDVHFEELVSQGVTLSEVRAYILLRQSQLSAEDRKKIVVEMGGTLDHTKVGASIRLLGSRFFSDLQGLRGSARNKTYDANITEETATDETERAYQATSSIPNSEEPETEIDGEYLEAMIAAEDQDALQVQAFEEELEGFFQETPDLQEALISYLDARNRLLQKKKARGFWPVSSSKGGKSHRGFKGKGRGKSAAQNQLLARIARSTCRACGERGHWRAECPKYGKPGSMSNKGEATTTFADVPEDSLAAASSQDGQTTEVFTSVPADALSLEEALVAKVLASRDVILNRLQQVVKNLKSRALKLSISRQADSGETSPADASGVPQQRAACAWRSKRAAPPMQVPHSSAHALLSSGSVEAILDTGASRCVMGKSLVSTFLSQLSDVVRDQVKVTQSAVRFRFGNNQTLVSERRILIPLRTANSSILWLGIEVVPGGTPLLLSKKAIKQLGGVIDTTADVCHLKRLQKKLQLRTGPTGLYMVDLARLCEESSQELQCHIVREDCFDETPQIRICMSTDQSLNTGSSTVGCTASRCSLSRFREKNSRVFGFRKTTNHVNAMSTATKRPLAPTSLSDTVSAPCAAASPLEVPPEPTLSDCFDSACSVHHGNEQGQSIPPEQSGSSLCSSSGSCHELHDGRDRESQRGDAGRVQDRLRSDHEGQNLHGSGRNREGLGEMVLRPPRQERETLSPSLHDLHREVHRSSRGDRSHAALRDGALECPSPSISANAQSDAARLKGSSQKGSSTVGAVPGPVGCGVDDGRPISDHRAGEQSDITHEPDGECHAAGVGSSPGPTCSVPGSVADRPFQLSKLSRNQVRWQQLEEQARTLVRNQAPLANLRCFLQQVPWDQLKGRREGKRSILTMGSKDSEKPGDYLVFGMYAHGGITGITTLSKELPWLTCALTRMVRLTNPQQKISSIAVSCNTCASPHRDSYNDPNSPNCVIPIVYPKTGGQVWVANPQPDSRSSGVSMLCGQQNVQGTCHPLRDQGVYLKPQEWHATMPWTGDRVVAISYVLKAFPKLKGHEMLWLRSHGFRLPSKPRDSLTAEHAKPNDDLPSSECLPASPASPKVSQPESAAQSLQDAAQACAAAIERAEAVHQDSMRLCGPVSSPRIDLLEVYAYPDSRITSSLNQLGGKAVRFTRQDGDLATQAGQQKLWDLVHQLQPRHIWVAPDCRLWCSWSYLNASRSSKAFQNRLKDCQADQIHLRLCAELFEWQRLRGRAFHMEQPARSGMLDEKALTPIVQNTWHVHVDMCAFGLRTPVHKVPIQKRTIILSSSKQMADSLRSHLCQKNHEHHRIAGRVLGGVPASVFAGSYCQGFADHVARQMCSKLSADALAVDPETPRTRKRFKTSVGTPVALSQPNLSKREAPESSEGSQRSVSQRRRESPMPMSLHDSSALPTAAWQSVFDMAALQAGRATSLVHPGHEIVDLIQQNLSQMNVLQVFLSKGTRNLQSPLGALPSTVAPWRVSVGQVIEAGQAKFMCLGNEERAAMPEKRKKMRIQAVEYLFTIFGSMKDQTSVSQTESTSLGDHLPDTQSEPNLEGWAPPPVPLHGPAFRNLDRESKNKLIRIHNNLGHPAPTTLARHLKAAGESSALVDAALEYQCDACLESTEPRHQRPSKLPEHKEFNDLIGVDGFFFKGRSGYKAYVLHALDEASCFHLGRRVLSRQTSHATKTLSEFWFSWAGNPRKIYLDPAGEFRSAEILDYFQSLNIQCFITAAAWQRGRLERHGDVLKDMLARMDAQSPLASDDLFDQALLQAFQAKNALMRHQGYAPEQIVLGKSLRVPGSLTSDEDLTSHAMTEGPDLESERQRQRLEVRCSARKVLGCRQ